MPHADSSYFAPGLTKTEVYSQVLEQAKGLLDGQRNWVSNLANVSSLLWHAYAALPAPSSAVNWAGFYVRQDRFPSLVFAGSDTKETPGTQTLLLGPFHGKPACQLIQFGRGVCGTAAEKRETVLVPDVLNWEGHIACDAESRSEIVVPILVNGETVAIIDIDCTQPSGFDEVDRKWLEALAVILADSCDW
ncbi:GAF domain nucleotide-binding protein [Histoplasma capsulatum G186AR]|uniref:GAF domain nucleotide-binding protein n=1 Tax=Ajellomyces capsulatus TaxID=5037 RepID=A0A8H8D7C9_AJECA|nr:GAF domain nucleotide-binding protein [Histoplasma capsulatum]QSS69934.1 GAF domain nucleotide-binding protein [Histoplasma capsulatum G186AR]